MESRDKYRAISRCPKCRRYDPKRDCPLLPPRSSGRKRRPEEVEGCVLFEEKDTGGKDHGRTIQPDRQ